MNEKQIEEFNAYMSREYSIDGGIEFVKEHRAIILDLMGGPWVEQVTWHIFRSPEDFKHFVNENPSYKADLRQYERHGYAAGCASSKTEYDHHEILLFMWQFPDFYSLNEAIMHEVAHVLTAERYLLAGAPQVMTFVSERIIIPWLESIYYVPTLQALVGRREWLEDVGRRKPFLPRRT